jgi:glycosyltransferase EpsD
MTHPSELASGQVLFPGYVRNIPQLYAVQAAVSTSRNEGKPFNIMEAMAAAAGDRQCYSRGIGKMATHGENGLFV